MRFVTVKMLESVDVTNGTFRAKPTLDTIHTCTRLVLKQSAGCPERVRTRR